MFEHLGCERSVATSKRLRIESSDVPFEQLNDDVHYGALARATRPIEDEELLDLLGIPGDNCSDRPFYLLAFFYGVERPYQLIPGREFSGGKRVRKSPTRVVFLCHLRIGEGEFLVKGVTVVAHVVNEAAGLLPAGAAERTEVPHLRSSS